MPDRHKAFARGEIFPSWWPNAIAAFLSTGALNFAIERQTTTTLRIPAAAGTGLAAIAIQGRWRYAEAPVTRVVAGAAGARDLYVTAAENVITNVPDPNTDITNYGFALEALIPPATPVISAGVVDVFRKIGSCDWDGVKITKLRADAASVRSHYLDTGWAGLSGAAVKKSAAAAYTLADVRDILDTLIDTLIDAGMLAA